MNCIMNREQCRWINDTLSILTLNLHLIATNSFAYNVALIEFGERNCTIDKNFFNLHLLYLFWHDSFFNHAKCMRHRIVKWQNTV